MVAQGPLYKLYIPDLPGRCLTSVLKVQNCDTCFYAVSMTYLRQEPRHTSEDLEGRKR